MAFPLLGLVAGLFKNPIISAVADATIGAVKHNLEKKKIIRAAEIEAAKTVDVAKIQASMQVQTAQVNASSSSWKDEWLTLVFSGIMVAHFIPQSQPYMQKGWEMLSIAPDMFWYIVLAIVSGSFGINAMTKFKK
jgi:hypothetical protein|tara:strand:- start:1054 stop:1458 length:405 start_codon:yes stop_codon:yes gene_type:complete